MVDHDRARSVIEAVALEVPDLLVGLERAAAEAFAFVERDLCRGTCREDEGGDAENRTNGLAHGALFAGYAKSCDVTIQRAEPVQRCPNTPDGRAGQRRKP